MQGLEQHYGTDSSLEPELVQLIGVWLLDNAAMVGGKSRRFSELPPEDRITMASWYTKKHRKIDDTVWRLESVKSKANCEACHDRAEEGHFDDKNLTIPEGLSALQKRPFLKSKNKHGSGKYGREQRKEGFSYGL
jgi:hypothetical protein